VAVILTVFIGGVIFFHLLEKLLARPVVGGYKTSYRRRGYLADVTSAIVNGPVMSAATKIAAYWMVTFVPAWHRSFGAWPWIAQFLLFFLCNDFGRYWLHRWYHASDLLWRLHRVHHATACCSCRSSYWASIPT
jgi:sterol desaturase/sphingolipid hydroxylase (fatty acid hydroxylase superfamily)